MMPDEDVRPVETSLRSTLFISKNGNMYRFYHDTETWVIVMPRCNDHGKTCGYKNKSLERLIAEAWLPRPEHKTATGRMPSVRVKDETKPSLDADNLEWCIGRRCISSDTIQNGLPYKLELLKDLLENETLETLEEVAENLNVSVPTVRNYMCKLMSYHPNLELAEKIVAFTNQTCLSYCLDKNLSGSLRELAGKIESNLGTNFWENDDCKFFDVRVCRMYCDILSSI